MYRVQYARGLLFVLLSKLVTVFHVLASASCLKHPSSAFLFCWRETINLSHYCFVRQQATRFQRASFCISVRATSVALLPWSRKLMPLVTQFVPSTSHSRDFHSVSGADEWQYRKSFSAFCFTNKWTKLVNLFEVSEYCRGTTMACVKLRTLKASLNWNWLTFRALTFHHSEMSIYPSVRQ